MIVFGLVLAATAAGYFAGREIGVKEGYSHAMQHVENVINKLEKLYRNGI